MKIFLEPLDVLMFRDGRPFSGGDDHFARGVFPPPPSTLYGAIRSHILSNTLTDMSVFTKSPDTMPEPLRREMGTPDKVGTLSLTQCCIGRRDNAVITPLFPMPRDVVKEKGSENTMTHLLKPEDLTRRGVITDTTGSMLPIWYPTDKPLEAVSGFLPADGMERYLAGKAPSMEPNSVVSMESIYTTEERTMVRKSRKTRSVETGALYTVEYARLHNNSGFLLDVKGTENLPQSGIMRLGGDNRTVSFNEVLWNDIAQNAIRKIVGESGRLKIVLLTPAIFQHGWLPGGIDTHTGAGSIEGVKLRVKGACMGRPIGIGGFDMVRNMPKTMKHAAPAGSVFFCEIDKGDVNAAFDRLWLKSISDERNQEGFGISLIGGY